MTKPNWHIKIVLSLFFTIFSLNSMDSLASLTVEDYRLAKMKDPKLLDSYIWGVGEGLSWYDVYQQFEGGKYRICPPKNMRMDRDIYIRILDAYIDKLNPPSDNYIAYELLKALLVTFPCEN